MPATTVHPARVQRFKTAYTVRNLDLSRPLTLVREPGLRPRHGDLAVARVTAIGHQKKLQSPSGRQSTLYVGDEIVLACAPRYAPDQFEAELPEDLGPCDLAAAGGVMAKVRSKHAQIGAPTRLEPLGLLGDDTGRVLNLEDLSLGEPGTALHRPPTIVVVGTSMNSGKTTTVAALVHGLTRAGLRVGAAKLTGTGACGDPWLFHDAGAAEVLDFTDAGLATTFRISTERLVRAALLLHGHLIARGVEAIVLEIADGVLQPETASLLDSPEIRRITDGVLFTASEAAGALFGVTRLRACGHPVLAVSGLLTMSPLATREAQSWLDVPVYAKGDLIDPTLAKALLERADTSAVLTSASEEQPA